MHWQAGLTISEPELEAILRGLLRTAEDEPFSISPLALIAPPGKGIKV
jgi:hypothetical protein